MTTVKADSLLSAILPDEMVLHIGSSGLGYRCSILDQGVEDIDGRAHCRVWL